MAKTNAKRTSGQTHDDWTDFVHTGPGTIAGRYMRTFWHPVCCAADLAPGKAKPVRIMSAGPRSYGTPQ